MSEKGKLYICPTPLGNLEDITLRAVRILREVDLVACEDTRITQKLLNHYDIHTKLISYHKFSEKQKSSYIIGFIEEGKDIALVSDAGTPLISDPGGELIKLAYEKNIKIIPLPGASSVTTALCASYAGHLPFVFIGFLPKTAKEKEQLLLKYQDINIVAFESPNRLVKTLQEALLTLGSRHATIARELTKVYEEIKRDSIGNLIDYYFKNPPRGEIILIIEGEEQHKTADTLEIQEKIRILSGAGYGVKELSKIISLLCGGSRKEIYELAVKLLDK